MKNREWHRWYAWYPIRIDGKRVFRKNVLRRQWVVNGKTEWEYRYMPPGSGWSLHDNKGEVVFSGTHEQVAPGKLMESPETDPVSRVMIVNNPTSPQLLDLIEKLKDYKMSPLEKFEQRVSFVYGQLSDSDHPRTKDQIRESMAEMYGFPLKEMQELAQLRTFLKQIEFLRSDMGDSIHIRSDNEEARTNHELMAVDCSGFWTDFEEVRFLGANVMDAMNKAAAERAARNAKMQAENDNAE